MLARDSSTVSILFRQISVRPRGSCVIDLTVVPLAKLSIFPLEDPGEQHASNAKCRSCFIADVVIWCFRRRVYQDCCISLLPSLLNTPYLV